MRIQHNISALNAHRQLGINNTAVGKNLEKLSSGYRINRAGDDAAGLAISEKMRGQIRGLDMASRNSNDGISLIQTAEGALNETHSILQRMRELAVQSTNGTYTDASDNAANSDRDQLQKEVAALKDEITRIADSTHFNNKKLLNGDLADAATVADAFTAPVAGTEGEAANVASRQVIEIDISGVTTTTAATRIKINGVELTPGVASGVGDANGEFGFELALAYNNSADAKLTGYTASVDATGEKLILTADTMGAQKDFVSAEVSTDTGIAGGLGATNVTTVGVDQGGGTPATKASYEFKLDLAALKGGESIFVEGHEIEFSITEASDATDANKTIINIEAMMAEIEANVDGVVPGTDDADKQAAMDIVIGLVETAIGKGAANNGDGGTYTVGKTALSTKGTDNTNVDWKIGTDVTFTLTAGETGSKGNLDDVRVANSTQSAFVITEKAGKDIGAGTPEKFATATFELDVTKLKVGDTVKFGDKSLKITAAGEAVGDSQINIDTFKNDLGAKLSGLGIENGKVEFGTGVDASKVTIVADDSGAAASSLIDDLGTFSVTRPAPANADGSFPSSGVTFQIGANGGADQRVTLNVAKQDTEALGIDDLTIANDISANAAIDLIDKATASVSATRADLGALQNRLEHTVANLGTTSENLTAAESRIRDVDMASEMMQMTKNNILTQAAQSMLAQANTQPQGVLQLLQ